MQLILITLIHWIALSTFATTGTRSLCLHLKMIVENNTTFWLINNVCNFCSSDWFGMLHSWADSKKKSNLVLTIFRPGESISWLGNMQKLGPAAELDRNPYHSADNDEAETTPFPVMPNQRRSYNSQANMVWIKPSGLQVHMFTSTALYRQGGMR